MMGEVVAVENDLIIRLKATNFSVPWSHDPEELTSLSVLLGVRRTSRVKEPSNEESENYWHLNT